MISFLKRKPAVALAPPAILSRFLDGCSVEVMPKTLAKLPDIDGLFPKGTRVYIAHIAGTPIADMVATAKRLRDAGYTPMPHIPARLVPDQKTFEHWLSAYGNEAGVTQALVLAGGVAVPAGAFDSSMQLLDSGAFDRAGFTRLHVAGHPEGNTDIDTNGGDEQVMQALAWKQALSERSDAQMAIVTQFVFDADPVVSWARRIQAAGIDLPIHVGLAGPAKLQTLIKYAIACGVGPSIGVLRKRAADVTKLMTPYAPTDLATDLAEHATHIPGIQQAHLFPLGGIPASAEWLSHNAPPPHEGN